MFKNYLKIAVRNLRKYKGYTFINISSLTIGMTGCFLILLFVLNELSYDQYHENANRIYAVLMKVRNWGPQQSTPYLLVPTLKKEYPEIADAVRIRKGRHPIYIKKENREIKENKYLFADNSIFNIFTLNFGIGNPKTSLAHPHSVVLSREAAEKYFGDQSPLGKALTVNISSEWYDLKITGVLNEIPSNSDFDVDFIISTSVFQKIRGEKMLYDWDWLTIHSYILINEGNSPTELSPKLSAFIEKYIDSTGKKNIQLQLQPFTEMHVERIKGYIYLFSIIATLILLAACFNFIILSTARSFIRAKEIGLRKVIGANRFDLIRQIMSESILFPLIALPISLMLVEIILPSLNQLLEKQLSINYCQNWQYIIGFITVTIIVGIISGGYLSFYLSTFQPVQILKVEHTTGFKKSTLRRLLIVTQIGIFLVLTICTLLINNQLRYIQNKWLGFDREYLISIDISDQKSTAWYESFKNEIQHNGNIKSISGASFAPVPVTNRMFNNIPAKDNTERKINYEYAYVDYDFFKTLDMKIVAGRDFSAKFASDSRKAIILNESAVKAFELDSPVDEVIKLHNGYWKIIGVTNDLIHSFYSRAGGVVFYLNPQKINFILLRIRPDDLQHTIAYLKKQWRKFCPEVPFEFKFVDEEIEQYYRDTKKIGKLFLYFTILSILIACMGLFGFSSFMAEQKTKEITIRKVLGATIPSLINLLCQEFVKFVLFANIVAWPIAYFATNKWLQNFAYRIKIGWWIFVLAGGLALVIALVTVSTQAIKAALANPVESLRYE